MTQPVKTMMVSLWPVARLNLLQLKRLQIQKMRFQSIRSVTGIQWATLLQPTQFLIGKVSMRLSAKLAQLTTHKTKIWLGAPSSSNSKLPHLRGLEAGWLSWMCKCARLEWMRRNHSLMKESWLASDFYRKITSHSWCNMPNAVYLQVSVPGCTRRFSTLKSLRKKSTTTLRLTSWLPNGRQRLTIWWWAISTKSATMTSTLSFRTWWRLAWCFSSATGRFSTWWNWNPMRQSLPKVQTNVHAVSSLRQACCHVSTFRDIVRRFATLAIRRRSATSSSELCTANTSVNCRAFQTVQSRLSVSANCSKISCRCTNPRFASTWISSEFNRSEPPSSGSTSPSLVL